MGGMRIAPLGEKAISRDKASSLPLSFLYADRADMRGAFPILCLIVLTSMVCQAFLWTRSCLSSSSSSSGLLKARGGAVIRGKKSVGTARATSTSIGLNRTRVYKKKGFVSRLMGGVKAFVKSYFASLINPTFEKELTKSNSITSRGAGGGGSATAALKSSAARRKRTGGRRTGSISDLVPEPSCGG